MPSFLCQKLQQLLSAALGCKMLREMPDGLRSLKNDENSPQRVGMGREGSKNQEKTPKSPGTRRRIATRENNQCGLGIDPGWVISLCLWSVKGYQAAKPALWGLPIILTPLHMLTPPTSGAQQRHPSFGVVAPRRLPGIRKPQAWN